MKKFKNPEMEISVFDVEDVITTSADPVDPGQGGLPVMP